MVLALGGLLGAMPAQAIEFGEGEFQGSLDTTISHGLTFRVEERNRELAEDTNGNDGNLNYDRGLVSNTSKFTTDLDIGTGSFGAFVRATGFIDFENQNGERERTPLSDDAKDRVAKDLELLDAYVTAYVSMPEIPIVDAAVRQARAQLGREHVHTERDQRHQSLRREQAPIARLRAPGGAASGRIGVGGRRRPTDAVSVEGFYQLRLGGDPRSTRSVATSRATDYVGPGAEGGGNHRSSWRGCCPASRLKMG